MVILSVKDVTFSYGATPLFSGACFDVQHDDKIGLTGVNGCGKTTLLKLLNRELEPDAGEIIKASDCTTGVMEQHLSSEDGISVYEETLTVFSDLIQLERELDEIHAAVETEHSLIERQSHMLEKFERDGGLTYRSRTRSALSGIGFTAEEQDKPLSVLSGGEKSKLQLAKLLLGKSKLMLLDEPTNHLDTSALTWLEQFLLDCKKAFIVISHDRYFLDRVTARTLDMECNNSVVLYNGGYSKYLTLKRERAEYINKKYLSDTEEIKRIEEIIAQQKRFNQAHNYVTIASKQKSIDRIREKLVPPLKPPPSLRFNFRCDARSGNDVLSVQNAALSFGEQHLFSNVSFDIKRGERVFLLGKNGCGKSSLFKLILGKIISDCKIRLGERVNIGYYDQQQSDIDPDNDVLHEIWNIYPKMNPGEIRNLLGQFLFFGDDVFKKTSGLSGGEKARVLLLRLSMENRNFLLLDEPTNHLDLSSREALETALLNFKETMFIISHDRYLINKSATRILLLEDNRITSYDGNYDYYLEKISMTEKETISDSIVSKEQKPNDFKAQKAAESEKRKAETAKRKLEEKIADLEERQKSLSRQLQNVGADFVRAEELSRELEETDAEIVSAMEMYFDN